MTKYYFTADLHLGHYRIIKLSNRPFTNIHEHDNTIISNINNIVDNDDYLYILGDIGFHKDLYKLEELFKSLNGRKVIIIGNHDNISHFIQLKRMGIIEDVRESKTLVIGKDRLFLSHYPYREWPGYYHGAKHLFAHCHGNLEPLPNTWDVGVDVWNYKPVEYNELMNYFRREN